jgi:pyrroloquinoline quinone biosynthesis protein D
LPHDRPLCIAARFRLQWEPAQNAHVLLYPEGLVRLEGGAADVMRRIDGRITLGQLIADLEAAYPGADLRDDVIEFLQTAREKGWVRIQALPGSPITGHSEPC